MSLQGFSEGELRAELTRREHERAQSAFGLCPTCDGKIVRAEMKVTEEHRSAPEWHYWPVPPPDELTKVIGVDRTVSLTCENGHESVTEETRFWSAE